MSAEARLKELGIVLPEFPKPVGKYVQAVQVGELLYVAGHGPSRAGGDPIIGKIGAELTVAQGVTAARLCRANGDDLGATMVRLGMAWAFVRYSRDYVEQEAKARANKLGVHAHPCVPAWEWRAQMRVQ